MALTSQEVIRILLKSNLNLTVYAREMENEGPTAPKVYTVRSIGYYGHPDYDQDYGIMLGLEDAASNDLEIGKHPSNKGEYDCDKYRNPKAESRFAVFLQVLFGKRTK